MKTQLLRTKEFLSALSGAGGVSGYESGVAPLVAEKFQTLSDEIKLDNFSNVFALKKGSLGKYQIMLAAHLDEIGLIVTGIDPRGFLRFTDIAGVDSRTLLSQEVIIHGRRDIPGIIGTMPPHLLRTGETGKALKMEELGIDTGMSADSLREVLEIGDPITLRRHTYELLNNIISGKAFDDRAGVAAMAVCLEELAKLRFFHDVIAVATVQEEVGQRGAVISTYTVAPDLGIAIDVTHAAGPDAKLNVELGKGPVIGPGANIHPAIHRHFLESAQAARLPYQIEPVPGRSGTDAWAMQVSRAGIPTGLLSIPLRYMHTSVETLDLEDILNSGKLLAHFIAGLPEDLEEFLCC